MLNIDLIRIDGGTQQRASINQQVVADYADAIRVGTKMPTPVVFFDGATRWLADGFHRYHAYRAAGVTEIDVDERVGTQRDAILYSYGANESHGLRRTNDDKRRVVLAMLRDREWSEWPHRKIAEACKVSREYVSRLSAEIEVSCDRSQDTVRTVERSGTTYRQQTSKIGQRVAAKQDDDGEPADLEADAVSVPDRGSRRSATRSAKTQSPSTTRRLRRKANDKALSSALRQTRHGASLLYAHLKSAVEMINSVAASNSEFSAEELEILQRARKALGASSDADDELRESRDTIAVLAEEVDDLTARLAIEQMDVSEEEKSSAAELIADLRAQVKTLTAELAAMRISRDGFQDQVRELMKQVQLNRRELDKSRAAS